MGSTDWIDLVQNRDGLCDVVNAVMKIGCPYNAGNIMSNFSGRTLLHGVSK